MISMTQNPKQSYITKPGLKNYDANDPWSNATLQDDFVFF